MAYKNTIKRIAPHLEKVLSNDDNTYIYMFSISYKGTRINRCNLNEYFPTEVKNDNTAKNKVIELKVLLKNGVNKCEKKDKPIEKPTVTIFEIVEEELTSRVESGRASAQHVYNIKSTYMKHINSKIGHIDINNIKMTELKEKLATAFKEVIKYCNFEKIRKQEVLLKIKKVLRPMFAIAIDREYIFINPLDTKTIKDIIATDRKSNKSKISERVDGRGLEALVDYAHKMFIACESFSRDDIIHKKIQDKDFRMAFTFSFMTARRVEEVLKLTYENITSYGTMRSPKEITKSKRAEEYPIPPEFLKYLKPDGTGLIFPLIKVRAYHEKMRMLLDKLEVESHKEHKLYGHDKRNLFSSIMAEVTNRHDLADAFLSHTGSMKELYQDISIDVKIAFFERYWEILRSGKTGIENKKIVF